MAGDALKVWVEIEFFWRQELKKGLTKSSKVTENSNAKKTEKNLRWDLAAEL